MDYKLELVLIPVSDVDRAKKFYLGLHRAGRQHLDPAGSRPEQD
jgi:hypothetical protein